MAEYAQVLLPIAKGPFDYRLPAGMEVMAGDFVRVPFGRKHEVGVVWANNPSGEVSDNKIREIEEKLDIDRLNSKTVELINWVAEYTLSPVGSVLGMVISAPKVFEHVNSKTPEYESYQGKGEFPILSKQQQRAVDMLIAQVRGKEARAINRARLEPADARLSNAEDSSPGQEKSNNHYHTTLLDGVTGSGKTEVYTEVIREVLKEGRQALVLLPEIALTTQLVGRLEKRLGFTPVQWHSGLTPKWRRENWKAVHEGRAKLVVGARSALFLPYQDLAFIVVDEEHEGAYKQEDGVIYHARDMAVARAFIEDFPILLVSATPSLETIGNVKSGKFSELSLPKRHGSALMPEINIVDMRDEELTAQHWLSAPLKTAMIEALEHDEQVMLYLNRRGYAPLTLCRKCGHRFHCPECSAWLVMHKHSQKLQCHHCDHTEPVPSVCPSCAEENTLVACGPGVERIEEEVSEFFPDAKIAVMTSDMIENADHSGSIIEAMEKGETDIIIGTQMIAKGHHFPNLTLVGIIDADMGFEGGDLRAAEKTYQLLHQVSGRAGREDLRGMVMMQSYDPDNPVMQALVRGDRDAFIAGEYRRRERAFMPPFSRLAALVLSGKNEKQVAQKASELVARAPRGEGVTVLGPAPAPISRLRGVYRYRILLRVRRDINIQKLLHSWCDGATIPSSIRLKIDIDPHSFY